MTTISKFYLLDAATPNTGTMPSNDPSVIGGGPVGTGSSAAGASTARDATDVPGTSNPDLESVVTAQAAATTQTLGHRRFVSRPLAAHTFASADGTWTFSCGAFYSNTNHVSSASDGPQVDVYFWRPSTGLRVGTAFVTFSAWDTPSLTTAEASRRSTTFATLSAGPVTISDGDILVFDAFTTFTQGMATAYTESFSYNGTTEASTTTCASFVTPPAALTLFTGAAAHSLLAPGNRDGRRGALPSRILRSPLACYMNALNPKWASRKSGLLVPAY